MLRLSGNTWKPREIAESSELGACRNHTVWVNCVSVSFGGSLQLVNASSSISKDESGVSLHLASTTEKWHCLPHQPSIRDHLAALFLALYMGLWKRILHCLLLDEISATLSVCGSQALSSYKESRAGSIYQIISSLSPFSKTHHWHLWRMLVQSILKSLRCQETLPSL